VHSDVRTYRTGDQFISDLTDDANAHVVGRGDGLLNIFVPHATAGLAVIELHAGTEADLAAAVERLLPRSDIYAHRHGSQGHGRDHVLPAFTAPVLTLPVVQGRVPLGTWQSIVLVDSNADNPTRQVRYSFVAGS